MLGKKRIVCGRDVVDCECIQKENKSTFHLLSFQKPIWNYRNDISGTRTKDQSILIGSLTAMLKSPTICHAVISQMMVYIKNKKLFHIRRRDGQCFSDVAVDVCEHTSLRRLRYPVRYQVRYRPIIIIGYDIMLI